VDFRAYQPHGAKATLAANAAASGSPALEKSICITNTVPSEVTLLGIVKNLRIGLGKKSPGAISFRRCLP
jgi:hypothetical protein